MRVDARRITAFSSRHHADKSDDKVSIGLYHEAGANLNLNNGSVNSWFEVKQVDTVPVLAGIPSKTRAAPSKLNTSNSATIADATVTFLGFDTTEF